MSDLPAQVHQAGLLLQQHRIYNDPQALEMVRQWGHAQIVATYPEDPLRAPLNLIRRRLAHMEWDRVVRTYGKELRGTIMDAAVRQLEFEIQRRQTDVLARDAEARRQEASGFDTRQRIQEHEIVGQLNWEQEEKRMRLAHQLQQEAEERASKRRIREATAQTEEEIRRLITRITLEQQGPSTADEVVRLVEHVTTRLKAIRQDASMDDDDRHIAMKTLLDSLPLMIHSVRTNGR